MTGIVSCDSKPMVLKARLTFRRIVPGKCCKRWYLSASWYIVSFSFSIGCVSIHLEFLHFAGSPIKLGEARKHTCAEVR